MLHNLRRTGPLWQHRIRSPVTGKPKVVYGGVVGRWCARFVGRDVH